MPSFTTSALVGTVGITLLTLSTVLAEEPPHVATIALAEQSWALNLDITGYRVQVDGVKPDGRRYFFATNTAASMQLSITLETISGQATEQGCAAHLERISPPSPTHAKPNTTHYEIRHVPVVAYLTPEPSGTYPAQRHLFACVPQGNVYADIHLSKTGVMAGDDVRLQAVLRSLEIVPAGPPSSLDHFRAGSAPYLQGKFRQAIPHYEQALALEQAHSTLDKAIWRLLVHNLGTAYGMAGDFSRAKITLDYGLSEDPANVLFHYHLARTYAEMNERDKAMQSLHTAFRSPQHQNSSEHLPDPRQDASFRRLMLDPTFRNLTESLMQPAI